MFAVIIKSPKKRRGEILCTRLHIKRKTGKCCSLYTNARYSCIGCPEEYSLPTYIPTLYTEVRTLKPVPTAVRHIIIRTIIIVIVDIIISNSYNYIFVTF